MEKEAIGMLRGMLKGALAFGLSAAAAGYVWTAFEFPFAIVLPGLLGWMVVAWDGFGTRKAVLAGLVGGVAFTAAFLTGMFFALTDGSPLSVPAWLAASAAAAVAGALSGAVLAGRKGAVVLAVFTAVGMFLGEVLAWLLRTAAPAAVDVPGQVQYGYFALAIGLVGLAVGALVGAGVERLTGGGSEEAAPTARATGNAA